MDAGSGAILRRIIILKTSGHADHGGFNIGGDSDELALVVAISDQPIECADAGDGQRRRTAQPGAGRGQAVGGQMKPGGWFEEVNQLGDQFETFFANQIFDGGQFGFKSDFAIARFEHDAAVIARFDLAMSAQRSGEIYGRRAGMKEIKRPDVDRAAGKIDAGWCGRFNKHQFISGPFELCRL